jgi:hypothetical protein
MLGTDFFEAPDYEATLCLQRQAAGSLVGSQRWLVVGRSPQHSYMSIFKKFVQRSSQEERERNMVRICSEDIHSMSYSYKNMHFYLSVRCS